MARANVVHLVGAIRTMDRRLPALLLHPADLHPTRGGDGVPKSGVPLSRNRELGWLMGRQLGTVDELRRRTIKEERNLSGRMAVLQENMSDNPLAVIAMKSQCVGGGLDAALASHGNANGGDAEGGGLVEDSHVDGDCEHTYAAAGGGLSVGGEEAPSLHAGVGRKSDLYDSCDDMFGPDSFAIHIQKLINFFHH